MNLYKNLVGIGNHVVSKRSLKTKVHVIDSIYPGTTPILHCLEPLIIFFFLKKILFFDLLLLNGIFNGTNINGTFQNVILKFKRPSLNSAFKYHNPQGIKVLTRLCLSLSHFCENKFHHNFQDLLNPLRKSSFEVE